MIYILLPFLLLFSNGTNNDWKTLSEEARILGQQGYHENAARVYEDAWLSNENEVDLLVAAGEEYLQARLYKDAARVFDDALMDGSNAAFLQYKLGLALKGNGEYHAAMAMLSESLQIEAKDSYIMKEIIRTEIAGCQMAMTPLFKSLTTKIDRLNQEINSSASDYAPMAVSGDKLYFASYKSGSSQVYESLNLNGSWTTPSTSKDFKNIIEGNYNGGTFNKDMSEFYFSVCDPKPTMSAVGNNCKIFKSTKSARGWSKPIAMRDYINWSGASTSHPTIVYEGDTEVLYFTSNRKGGQGGMDIWYATREVNSSEIDFTFPINAGPVINTMKDDVTPFYDRADGVLYFSSDGHESAGGLDVFKIRGKRSEWSQPQNMGAPVNSSSDDYYYNSKIGTETAFLTSNRLVDGGQKTTSDDDIFEIDFSASTRVAATAPITPTGTVTTASTSSRSSSSTGSFTIKGRVTDASNGAILPEPYVTLYKAVGESNRRKVETVKSPDGRYDFKMQPGEYYIVEAFKPGYQLGDFEFNTDDLDSGIAIDIPLNRAKGYAATKIQKQSSPSTSNAGNTRNWKSAQSASTTTTTVPSTQPNSSTTYTPSSSTTTNSTTTTYTPSAPAKTYTNIVPPSSANTTTSFIDGVEFRIQLTAVSNYNPMLPLFTKARKYGTLGTELHPNGSLTRVFLRSFSTYDQAKSLVDTMKSLGFDTAFVVKYQDGRRTAL